MGANINLKDKNGQTPLFYAAKEGHLNIIEFLIKANANPNEVDLRKQTAIKFAIKNNH